MSDVDTTAKLISQLEADYYTTQSFSNDSDDAVKSAAKKLVQIAKEFEIESKTMNDLLLEPENINMYYDIPIEFIDKVFQITENLDPFEIQKLSRLVA